MAKKKVKRPARGAPLTLEDLLPAIQRAQALETGLGGTGRAFNIVSGARAGEPSSSAEVAEILQPGLTMHELTGAQRFLQGKELGETMGIPLATLANIVYTGDKALSQALGRSERFIPIDDVVLDPTTSKASLANLLSAQAGIASQSPLVQQISDLFSRQAGGPIPNQTSGTKMPKAKIRVPAADLIQQFQSGGLVGDLTNQLRNINVDTSQIENIINNLTGIAGKMQGFDPFGGTGGGAAASTLQNMLTSGAPVDVSPITEAAQGEAQRAFQQMMGGTNEQFGALGLGSSSARQQQLGRQAAGLAGQVGAQGLRAGVGAQEAARNRQMQAFQPFFQGTGQQLTGLTGAGQQLLGAGNLGATTQNLGLQSQLGQTGGMQNLISSQMPAQQQQMMMPSVSRGGGGGGGGGGGIPKFSLGATRHTSPKKQATGGFGGFGGGTSGFGGLGFQAGGRADFGDYLSNLLYGQKFARRRPQPQPEPQPSANIQGVQSDLSGMLRDLLRESRRGGSGRERGEFGGFTGGKFADAFLPTQERFPGLQGPAASRQPYLSLAGPLGSANLAQYVLSGAMQNLGRGRQEGGIIDGPAVPPDQVPIMAQGGEGVIPVGLMNALENSNSEDPLIKELQNLMGFDKMACGGKVKFQAGGQIPTITDPTQAVQQQGLQQGGAGTFSQLGAPVETPEEELDRRRAISERRLALLRSAIATAANPERATTLLTPRIAEAEAEVSRLAGEQDALRARQQEELRTEGRLQEVETQVQAQRDIAEQQLGAQQQAQEAEQQRVLAERQEADRESFTRFAQQLIEEPDPQSGMGGRSPEEALVLATQLGPQYGIQPTPEAQMFAQQYQAQNIPAPDLNAALVGVSLDDLDENTLISVRNAVDALLAGNRPKEEIEDEYQEIFRIVNEFAMRGVQ